MMKKIIFSLIIALIFQLSALSFELSYAQSPEYMNIPECPLLDSRELMDKISSKVEQMVVLDIRFLKDYKKGHIPGAISISAKGGGTMARERIISEIGISDKVIIVDDGEVSAFSDGTSWFICGRMKDFGYRYVYILKGGMNNWDGPIEE